jgi:hypothetical protein
MAGVGGRSPITGTADKVSPTARRKRSNNGGRVADGDTFVAGLRGTERNRDDSRIDIWANQINSAAEATPSSIAVMPEHRR